MQIIPIKAVPAQSIKVTLNGQACRIEIRQTPYGVFLNLYINEIPVVVGAICQDRNRVVRSTYLGFIGDLMIEDTAGTDDPTADGLGSRFQLVYLDPGEVVAA